jgi:hypothetical protein
MVLTDTQIERYSRQIIVPGVGGHAQERLLASRVAIVAAPADASGAVAYLAGAGVGHIVMHPVGDGAPCRALVERIGDLNPDVSVEIASDEMPEQCDFMLALIGDAPAAEAAARVAREYRRGAAIIARLDMPPRIALFAAPPPPCPLCGEVDLLSPLRERADNAGAIAMVAVTEAFRLLAGLAGQRPEATLIEFDGYAIRSRALHRRRVNGGGGEARCACAAAPL